MEGTIKNQEATWDKLESVLNYEESLNYREIHEKKLAPIRKLSVISSRVSDHRHDSRSFSISKESPYKQQRPSTSASNSRTNTLASIVPGLSLSQLQSIYASKCSDLEIPLVPDQEKRFFNFCATSFQDRKFSLKHCGLGSHSAKQIGEIIKNNNYFAFLNLEKNFLKDQGTLILAKCLKKSMNIVHLDVSSNEITSEGSELIILELLDNQSLASLDISSHEGLHRNRLGIQGAQAMSKMLKSNPVLAFLNLAGTGLGPEGLEILLEGLKNNHILTSLNLANNYFGEKPIRSLAEVLVETELKELNISANKIGNEGCEYISLMLSGGLNSNCSIMKINLSDNEINSTGISKIFAALRINSQLKQLDFRKNQLAKGLSKNMVQCFTENITLELINLSYCELKCEGLVGIAEGLSKNTGIRSLYLNNNSIQDKGVEMISIGIAKNKVLKLIDLSSNKICDKGGLSLGKAIQVNNSVEAIYLKDNNLKDISGQLFSEISRFKPNILKISLDLNPMNLKYMIDIKRNVLSNFEYQQKLVVPKLQKIIDKIYVESNALEELNGKIAKKKKERNDAEHKLKNQGNKLENIKETEEEKLIKIKEEYSNLRDKSIQLSQEIEELNTEMNVYSI